MQQRGLKRRWDRALAVVFATTTMVVAASGTAVAAPSPPASRYASIVLEAETGAVLYERNADLPRYPASLTKIMTLYLTFEAIAAKKLALTDELVLSPHAAGQDPSRLDLAPGSRIKVEDAIRAMTTKSANDAACAIAERLGKGSEAQFAEVMTAKGKALGLKQTTFHNASGLPAEGHMSSARDLALLCKALVHDFPEQYRYFSTSAFEFHGTRYPNQNRFLRTYYGADGIKTGFVNASGHNLAASAVRGGKRLISIVLGGDSQGWTREHATRLLDVSYAKIDPSLVMVASNATNPAAPPASAAPPPATYATPAGAVTITPAAPLPLPNATANLAAFAAASSAPRTPAGSVSSAPTEASPPAQAPTTSAAAVPVPAASQPTAAAPVTTPTPTPTPVTTPVTTPPPSAAAPENVTASHSSSPPSSGKAAPSRQEQKAVADAVTNAVAAAVTEEEAAKALPPKADRSVAATKPVAAVPSPKPEGGPAPASAAPEPSPSATKPQPSAAAAATEPSGSTVTTSQAGGDWSVQVGLFRDATVARRRGEEARRLMPLSLRGADLVVGRALDGVHVSSRISRLSEQDARAACNELQRGRVPCVVVPPGRPLVVATN